MMSLESDNQRPNTRLSTGLPIARQQSDPATLEAGNGVDYGPSRPQTSQRMDLGLQTWGME